MPTSSKDKDIFRVDSAKRRPAGTRKVRGISAYIMTEAGWENADEILSRTRNFPLPAGPRAVLRADSVAPIIGSGFAENSPAMKIVMDVASSDEERPFEDVLCNGWFRASTWVITDKAKLALSLCDAAGFEFLPIETQLRQAGEVFSGPTMWLCDPIRFVNALTNVPRSSLTSSAHEPNFRFDSGALAGATFFRDTTASPNWVFCTNAGRAAVIDAGVTGLSFDTWGRQDA